MWHCSPWGTAPSPPGKSTVIPRRRSYDNARTSDCVTLCGEGSSSDDGIELRILRWGRVSDAPASLWGPQRKARGPLPRAGAATLLALGVGQGLGPGSLQS